MPRYTVLLDPEDDEVGGFAVSVPALPGCFSQGATRDEALANIREAIGLRLGVMRRDGEPFPIDISPIVASVDAEPINSSMDGPGLDVLTGRDEASPRRRVV